MKVEFVSIFSLYDMPIEGIVLPPSGEGLSYACTVAFDVKQRRHVLAIAPIQSDTGQLLISLVEAPWVQLREAVQTLIANLRGTVTLAEIDRLTENVLRTTSVDIELVREDLGLEIDEATQAERIERMRALLDRERESGS